ncbi:MAG: right-handed parallel beta-helix repeat-containing protein [Opitutales bacterium]|nr:right-handed parallel beta-helix repeat-containing protein [Opitutales bacterium]
MFSFGEDVEGGPGLFDEPVAIEFHVAPDGRLDAEGTVADPFPDLEGARNAIRSRRSDGEEGLAVVWVHGGDYDYRTRPTFTLGSEDRKTVYRAVAGESLPRFTGGVRVDGSSFELVDESSDVWDRIDTLARGHLLKLDLSSYGISDFGVLRNRGFNQSMPDGHMELVVDDEMMQLGRYPNGDEFSFVASGVDSRTFVYSGNRPERWTEAEDPWLHGIWGRDWADGARAVADIDLNARQIKMTSSPTQYGISSNQYYFAFNLLEEIDEPGEYYINRDTGILYFWPDRDLSNARILLTKRSSGPIIRTNGASDITFEGLVLEASRTRLVEVVGGSTRVVFRYCRLMHAGNTAISINPQMGADGSGRNNGLYRCELKNLAGVGVFLEGGDLSSLEPGGNFVEGCRIHNFSRLSWTYRPAVSLGGVGQIVRHNEIFNAPHSAILLRSTASLVEYNHIYDVVRWSGDSAAIYGGRSWVRRRNIIRYNHIQDIASGRPKVTGIYLDDALSGTHVIGNILQGIQDRATTNNGGRDNVWSNNYIIDSDVGHYTTTMGVIQVNEDFLTAMRDVGYQQPPWSTAFPELAAIPDDYSLWTNETKAPQNTIFERNILWNNTEDISERLYSGAANPLSYYASLSDNLMGSDPMFADPQNGDFTLHFDSPAFAIPGFVEIPFGKIGRGALNVRDWPMPLDERAGQMTLSALIESDREIESVVLFYGDLDGGSESGAWSHSIVTRGPKNSGFVQVRMDLSQDEIYYARWRVIDENGVVRWTPTFGPLIGDGTGFNPIQVTEVALDDNGFIVTLDGLDVRTKYRLLRSSDLKSWTPVVGSEKFPEDSMESFIDSFSQEEKSLFYMVDRVREE